MCPCAAKYADYKTSWPPEPIGHKSWKANRGSSQSQLSRPPPGLASQKQPSPSPWSGGGPRLAGRGWGSGSSTSGNTFIHVSPPCCAFFIEAQYLSNCSVHLSKTVREPGDPLNSQEVMDRLTLIVFVSISGSSWSDGSSRDSCWLVLSNLTPQVLNWLTLLNSYRKSFCCF